MIQISVKSEVKITSFPPKWELSDHDRRCCMLMAEIRAARVDLISALKADDTLAHADAQARFNAATEDFSKEINLS